MAIGSATGAASTFDRSQAQSSWRFPAAQNIGSHVLSLKREAESNTPGTAYVWPIEGTVVIADLEYTSWDGAQERGWSRPNEHREVVQIGVVRLDAGDVFAERDAFQMLVRPTVNPVLSDYFMQLTGIDNAALAARGVALEAALMDFATFAGGAAILSNGADAAVVTESCGLTGIDNPLPETRWVDIGPALKVLLGQRYVGSAEIPALLGLPVEGPTHDALADARAIAAGLRHLRGQGKL